MNRFLPRPTGDSETTTDDPSRPTKRGVARKLGLALALAAFSYLASRWSESRA
ncbi:hypothetical protein [Halostella salina]|uniref:hypothetical protein n=1 Tax=Halostella salina TaxID=1547897 RepID=UPI0013CE779B|nr:hypothetical protein [Halostella salina]